jgi:hypothetical protein
MAGTTDNRRYPFPGQLDADNVPADIQALAEAIDTDVAAVKAELAATTAGLATALSGMKIDSGMSTIEGGPSWTYTRTRNFNFSFSSPPRVLVSIVTAAGGTDKVQIRPINITATGFTAWIFTVDRSLLNTFVGPVPIHWIAIGAA